jgi:hypothetical protein
MLTVSYVYLSTVTTSLRTIAAWLNVAIMWQRCNLIESGHRAITRSYRSAAVQLAVIIALSVVYNSPQIVERRLVIEGQLVSFEYTELGKSWAFRVVYKTATFYVVNYIVPMGLLAQLVHKARMKLSRRVADAVQSSRAQKEVSKSETTRSLVVVVCVFACCHLLAPVRRILLHFFPRVQSRSCGGILFYVNPLLALSSMLYCSANFIIYICFIKKFKQLTIALFKKNAISPDPIPTVTASLSRK